MVKRIYLLLVLILGNINLLLGSEENVENEYVYAIIEAKRQEAIGSIVESAKLLQTCLKYDPDDPVVLYKLSKLYYSVNSINEAIDYAEKAVKFDRKNEWINYNLIHLYTVENQFKRAKNTIKKVDKDLAQSSLIQRSKAELLIKKGLYKKAIKYIESIDYRNRNLYLLLVHSYNKLKDYNASVNILKNLLDQNNEDVELLGLLAETLTHKKEFNKANNVYKQIFYIEPGNNLYLLSYFDYAVASENENIVLEYYDKLLREENISVSDKIYIINSLYEIDTIKYKEKTDVSWNYLFELYKDWNINANIIKEVLVRRDQREKAVNYLKKIKDYNLENPDYWQNLLFTIGLTETDTILKYGEIANGLYKNEPLFSWIYAFALKNDRQYSEAYNVIKNIKINAVKVESLQLELFVLKGEILNELERFEESDTNFERALTIDPDNYMVLNNYSYYLSLRDEKLHYALEMVERCIKKDPKNFVYLDTYGWVLYKLKNYKKAEKIIKDAINNGGMEHSDVLWHYADILLKLKKSENASYFYNEALKYEKDTEKIDELKMILNEIH